MLVRTRNVPRATRSLQQNRHQTQRDVPSGITSTALQYSRGVSKLSTPRPLRPAHLLRFSIVSANRRHDIGFGEWVRGRRKLAERE